METKIEIPSCIRELDKSLKWARKIAKDPDSASQFEVELAASLLGIRNMLADARIFIGQCKHNVRSTSTVRSASKTRNVKGTGDAK